MLLNIYMLNERRGVGASSLTHKNLPFIFWELGSNWGCAESGVSTRVESVDQFPF